MSKKKPKSYQHFSGQIFEVQTNEPDESVRKPIGIDIENMPPRKNELYETYLEFTAADIPAAEKRRKEVAARFPFFTEQEVLLYISCKASAEVSTLGSNSNGGGRFPAFCRTMESKYVKPEHSIF